MFSRLSRPRAASVESRPTDIDDDDNLTFRIGSVRGLTSRSDLNGCLGRAVRWVPKKDRWAVIMIDTGEKVLLRDECLDFQSELAIKATEKGAIPAMGLPVAAATPAGADNAAIVATPAASGSPETGSPGHPVKGFSLNGAKTPSKLADSQPPPALACIFQAAQCFCLPFGQGLSEQPAISMAQATPALVNS
jgi:hypothetical protein